jgi:hypothetical protein
MNNEEKMLRAKFYLSPKEVTLESLREMDKKYKSYPGLTQDQAIESAEKLKDYKKTHTNK